MQQHKVNANERIWYSPQCLADPLEHIFSLTYWRSQQRVVGSAQGRGTTWFVQTASMTAALRHYWRGGLLGKVLQDQYMFTRWQDTRSYQEFKLLAYLHDNGVQVPRPIAARAIKSGCCYRADLLSEKIADAQDLVTVLSGRRLSHEEYHKIGHEIAKMHHLQVNHSDLNIHNILLDQQGQVWLIDFDKCHQQTQPGVWQQKNLARLQRSFRKEQAKRQIHWNEEDFEALLQGYQRHLSG